MEEETGQGAIFKRKVASKGQKQPQDSMKCLKRTVEPLPMFPQYIPWPDRLRSSLKPLLHHPERKYGDIDPYLTDKKIDSAIK